MVNKGGQAIVLDVLKYWKGVVMTRKWGAKTKRAKAKQFSNRTIVRRIANRRSLTDDLSGNSRPETKTMSRGKDTPTMTAEPEAITTPDEPTLTPLWTAACQSRPGRTTDAGRSRLPFAELSTASSSEARSAVGTVARRFFSSRPMHDRRG